MNIEEILKKWNGGLLRGAKKALADALGIPDTSVSHWIAGRATPSEKHVKKMSKLFGISEEEIKKLFQNSSSSLEQQEEIMFIPVLGTSSATEEKFVLEEMESYLPIKKSSKKQFAVRVEGDCMVDQRDPQNSIYSGNYVIVDPDANAVPGDVVIARIDGEYSTIKRFFPHDTEIRLVPDNPDCKTLVYNTKQVEIIGKVINVYRPIRRKKERI